MGLHKSINIKNILLIVATAILAIGLFYAGSKFISTKGHNRKVVALTFDDGPDPRFTPRILDILNKNGIKATFFMIGSQIDKYPDLARRVSSEGFEIGNHTYTHPDLKLDTVDQIKAEIKRCQDSIHGTTGQTPHFFRPPKGLFDDTTTAIAQKDGYTTVLWDVCVEHKASPTPEDEAKRVLLLVRPGFIILAHDGRLNREKTVKAIPFIIKGLKDKGYDFVTLEELIKLRHLPKINRKKSALVIR